MTLKFKLLILSLLGFSAACSGVKNNAKSQAKDDAGTVRTETPDIRLMYGVRRPVPVAKVDTLATQPGDMNEARSQRDSLEVRESQSGPRIVAMYGVRVPVENIDLDSLKRAQQQREEAGKEE